MIQKDGGPAFPSVQLEEVHYGMTLRDYFAAKALSRVVIDNDEPTESQPTDEMMLWIDWQATYAYAVADAMLRAREVKP